MSEPYLKVEYDEKVVKISWRGRKQIVVPRSGCQHEHAYRIPIKGIGDLPVCLACRKEITGIL